MKELGLTQNSSIGKTKRDEIKRNMDV